VTEASVEYIARPRVAASRSSRPALGLELLALLALGVSALLDLGVALLDLGEPFPIQWDSLYAKPRAALYLHLQVYDSTVQAIRSFAYVYGCCNLRRNAAESRYDE
jgi:hypothetical protein